MTRQLNPLLAGLIGWGTGRSRYNPNVPAKSRMQTVATDEKTQRVPTPPTTRKQEEEFAAEQEERQGDPAKQARQAIRKAEAALREAEDALDQL